MNTEFLKGLGIEDQSIIDKIFAEHGKDVNKVKGNTEQLTQQVADLQAQLGERDTQLKDLKKSVKDNEALTTKISELEEANKNSATDYQNKITELQKNHAIETGIRDAKGKNAKAIMALLDTEKITFVDGKLIGFNDQIKSLRESEDSSFLFQSENNDPKPPAGTDPKSPPAGGGNNPPTGNSFADAIAKALGGKN